MSSFAHLGYPGATPTPTLPQAPVTSSASPKSPPGSPCCETGRPIMTDPVTGQTICSCQYGPVAASIYAGVYPRVPAEALYSSAALAQGLLPHLGMSPTNEPGFYGGLASPYDFKGLATAGGLYSYDPSLAAYPYAAGFLDPNARRKNATRESTQTLKAWLSEHKKNPYPTKGEKIMLAIITKMTLTQVSTWFANARRRLKKENKMTWEPRNRMDDDDDDDVRSDDEDEDVQKKDGHDAEDKLEDENISVDSDDDDDANQARNFTSAALLAHANSIPYSHHHMLFPGKFPSGNPLTAVPHTTENTRLHMKDSNITSPTDSFRRTTTGSPSSSPKSSVEQSGSPKPKIWSMAEIATSSKDSSSNNHNNNNTINNETSSNSKVSTTSINSISSNGIRLPPPQLANGLLMSQTVHQGKMPSAVSHGLHPAWRGAAHPYLHPHFAQRLAAFPGAAAAAAVAASGQTPPRHMLPAFTSLPQLRHNDGSRISAFSPPSSATSPSAQADRNV